jgi:hypothetical protein
MDTALVSRHSICRGPGTGKAFPHAHWAMACRILIPAAITCSEILGRGRTERQAPGRRLIVPGAKPRRDGNRTAPPEKEEKQAQPQNGQEHEGNRNERRAESRWMDASHKLSSAMSPTRARVWTTDVMRTADMLPQLAFGASALRPWHWLVGSVRPSLGSHRASYLSTDSRPTMTSPRRRGQSQDLSIPSCPVVRVRCSISTQLDAQCGVRSRVCPAARLHYAAACPTAEFFRVRAPPPPGTWRRGSYFPQRGSRVIKVFLDQGIFAVFFTF